MSKSKKEIIDNEDGTMAEFLKNALKDNDGRVSIATGYFNVEGYAELRSPLQEAAKKNDFHLRLLIAMRPWSRRMPHRSAKLRQKAPCPRSWRGSP